MTNEPKAGTARARSDIGVRHSSSHCVITPVLALQQFSFRKARKVEQPRSLSADTQNNVRYTFAGDVHDPP
jgi:hypothetical protein